MKDLHVQDSGIGITIYALLQFHFKTTLPINWIDCSDVIFIWVYNKLMISYNIVDLQFYNNGAIIFI
jgi:hypothetical protein